MPKSMYKKMGKMRQNSGGKNGRSSGMVGHSMKIDFDSAGESGSVQPSGGAKGRKGARSRVPADRYN